MLHRGNPPQSGRDMVARVQGREAAAAPGLVQAVRGNEG